MWKNNPDKSALSLKQKIIILACGIIFAVVMLELGIRLFGGIFLFLQEHKNRVLIAKNGYCRIMCVGESTTAIGGGDSYPSQLEEVLNARKPGIKFSVINKGAIKIDTSFILSNLELNLDQCKPKIVVAMMGCNDKKIKYYENIPNANTVLFKSFRLYRLMRTLWLDIVNRVNKAGTNTLKQDREDPAQISLSADEALLNRAIKMKFRGKDAYFVLGKYYQQRKMFLQSEKFFKKEIKINPGSERAYISLGYLYNEQGKYAQAEASFKKAIEINQEMPGGYIGLGNIYMRKKMFSQAEEILNKAIEINPGTSELYFILGYSYMWQNKFTQAEGVFKKAVEISPRSELALGGLALLYEEMGKHDFALEYFKKINELRETDYSAMTYNNYRELKRILDKRGIKLICVQYPMRSIKPLKKIFEGQNDIMIVDNESLFKEAVKGKNYKEYFMDMFGGGFRPLYR